MSQSQNKKKIKNYSPAPYVMLIYHALDGTASWIENVFSRKLFLQSTDNENRNDSFSAFAAGYLLHRTYV